MRPPAWHWAANLVDRHPGADPATCPACNPDLEE